jgi:hypothetical protein
MRISTHLAAALLTGSALALTACGSDDGGTAGAEDRQQQMQDAALAYAECMRDHGVDVPDPEVGEGGGIRMRGPSGGSPEKMEEADKACQKHLDDVEPPELTEEQQKEFQDAALAHARCMREHGIDMPDPTFGEDGRAQVRINRGRGGNGVDPDDPKFREAEEACRDVAPRGLGGPSREESP